mmetsp:Transcript_44421/g.105934  ORF Transcript_44421/g.105934 Transcript_44421/m.105934 type:complete len:212 (+) Transcript_44421:359-994(+)
MRSPHSRASTREIPRVSLLTTPGSSARCDRRRISAALWSTGRHTGKPRRIAWRRTSWRCIAPRTGRCRGPSARTTRQRTRAGSGSPPRGRVARSATRLPGGGCGRVGRATSMRASTLRRATTTSTPSSRATSPGSSSSPRRTRRWRPYTWRSRTGASWGPSCLPWGWVTLTFRTLPGPSAFRRCALTRAWGRGPRACTTMGPSACFRIPSE